MRIAVITSGTLPVPPVDGGAVENLIDSYLKYNEINGKHEFVVYSVNSNKAQKEVQNYKKTRFVFVKTNSFAYKMSRLIRYIINRVSDKYIGNAYVSRIRKILKNDYFDLYILENCAIYSLALKSIPKEKLVLHLHNDTLYKGTKLDLSIANSYNHILAISNYLTNRVKSIGGSSRISTLYNGIDLSAFDKNLNLEKSLELRKQFNIKLDDIVILYTGRLDENKGIKHLIEAFNRLESPNVKLVIAGGVFYDKKHSNSFVNELLRISKNNERVVFTGYIDYEKIGTLYAMADIGVVPSLCEEGFGLTVLEHMATGIPLITTDSGAIPEIVDEHSAFVIKRDNQFVEKLYYYMKKLAEDRELRLKMGYSAKKKSVEFSNDLYNKRFRDFLGEFNE